MNIDKNMKDDKILEKMLYIAIFFILVIYFRGYFMIRYIDIIPTIKVYPDNDIEILVVNNIVEDNNQYYIDLFKKTDESVVYAFREIVDIDIDTEKMMNIVLSPHLLLVTLLLKTTINRARPRQINPDLNIQKSLSANTPAYPSGHCIQAYYLAKQLSLEYPERSDEFFKLAEDCALSRVYAGLHFPSDNDFGRYISLNIL